MNLQVKPFVFLEQLYAVAPYVLYHVVANQVALAVKAVIDYCQRPLSIGNYALYLKVRYGRALRGRPEPVSVAYERVSAPLRADRLAQLFYLYVKQALRKKRAAQQGEDGDYVCKAFYCFLRYVTARSMATPWG